MAKQLSRSARWSQAITDARKAVDEMKTAAEAAASAFESLKEIQSEYEEWHGNLPENLQSSALGEKLENVVGIDLEADAESDSVSELEGKLDEAEGAELPMGFGRD